MLNVGRGLFITLEGIEGVGKSTQVKSIQAYLNANRIPVIVTREPGGTGLAEAMRRLIVDQQSSTEKLTQDAELLLLFASRSQHLTEVIRPALDNQTWVVCDRFTDASYAYQGGGRGIAFEKIAFLEQWIQQGVYPDCVLLLDAPVELALQRAKDRSRLDRIEAEQHDFFQRARDTYLERAQQFPRQYRVIDATASVEEVERQVKHVLDQLLSKWV